MLVEDCPQRRLPPVLKPSKHKDVLCIHACLAGETAGLLAAPAAFHFCSAEGFQSPLGNHNISTQGSIPWHRTRCTGPVDSVIPRPL